MGTSKNAYFPLKFMKIYLRLLEHCVQTHELNGAFQLFVRSCFFWIGPLLNITSVAKDANNPAYSGRIYTKIISTYCQLQPQGLPLPNHPPSKIIAIADRPTRVDRHRNHSYFEFPRQWPSASPKVTVHAQVHFQLVLQDLQYNFRRSWC